MLVFTRERKKRRVPVLVVVVTLVCSVLATSVSAKENGKIDSYGGFVDVDGVKIFCQVDGGDRPVVVLDAAYGKDHLWTNKLAEELRETKEVDIFQYDRPGLGKSDKSNLLRTPETKANELHAILKARGITRFYYMGYALSGLTIREYAYLYPGEIQGIVMLDCASEDQIEGIETFLNSINKSLAKKFKSNFMSEDGTYDDLKKGIEQIKKISKFDSLRKIPMVVISGEEHGFGDIFESVGRDFSDGVKMELKWKEWQNNLASLSDESVQIDVDVYSRFVQKTEVKSVLQLMKIEIRESDYIDTNLHFTEGDRPIDSLLFRFFGFVTDGLGW